MDLFGTDGGQQTCVSKATVRTRLASMFISTTSAQWSEQQQCSFAKDSVYVGFLVHLAIINPARTIQLDGISRPAVLVSDFQVLQFGKAASPCWNAFELQWGSIDTVVEARVLVCPLMKLDLLISDAVLRHGRDQQ